MINEFESSTMRSLIYKVMMTKYLSRIHSESESLVLRLPLFSECCQPFQPIFGGNDCLIIRSLDFHSL